VAAPVPGRASDFGALVAYGRRVGRQIHMGDVWGFLNDRSFRNEVLDASSSRDGKEGVRHPLPREPDRESANLTRPF
jgi:hypothetical protein